MSNAAHPVVSAPTQARLPVRTPARWLLVGGAVAVLGVSIDLFRGPPASALPVPASQVSAFAAVPIDHSAVMRLADEHALEPGASVASYETPANDEAARAPASTLPQAVADNELERGASIAAYDR